MGLLYLVKEKFVHPGQTRSADTARRNAVHPLSAVDSADMI